MCIYVQRQKERIIQLREKYSAVQSTPRLHRQFTSFRMKRNQDCSHFQLVKPSFNLLPKQFSFSPSGFD